jgi:hypothetical protein
MKRKITANEFASIQLKEWAEKITNERHEMNERLHIMEIQRDRAVEIALDSLNGRLTSEDILGLANLIESTATSNE